MAEIYTGNVSLSYYRAGEGEDRYHDVLTLEAYGDTKTEVLRKLLRNTILLSEKYVSSVEEHGEGLTWYYNVVTPNLINKGNVHRSRSSMVTGQESFVRSFASLVFFDVNNARRKVLKEKQPLIKSGFTSETLEKLTASTLDAVNFYEEDFAVAVDDGRWSNHVLHQALVERQNEQAFKRRIEDKRAQEINVERSKINVNKAALRSKILSDGSTSAWFKLKNWVLTFG